MEQRKNKISPKKDLSDKKLPWWVELLFVQIGLPDKWLAKGKLENQHIATLLDDLENKFKPTTSIGPLCFSPNNSPAPLISKSLIAKLNPDKSDSFSCRASILSDALFFNSLVSLRRK